MQLENKVVIVTGASSGIGLEIAKMLAAENARLVLASRTMEKLESAASDLASAGAPTVVIPTDVTRWHDCQRLVKATLDTFGQVDILINNAGYGPPASLADTTEDLWDATLDVCLKGVYLMSRAVITPMLARNSGALVHISSVAGVRGYPNRTAYCAAKWGVQGFIAALKAELAETNIRNYAICPGVVATPWWDTIENPQPDDIMAKMLQAPDVAEAVRWVLTQPGHVLVDQIVMDPFPTPEIVRK